MNLKPHWKVIMPIKVALESYYRLSRLAARDASVKPETIFGNKHLAQPGIQRGLDGRAAAEPEWAAAEWAR